jgi:Ca2+-binding EF-hand superfamily protein
MVNAEVARLEKMFHEIDTNKDGVIDIQELTAGLRKMGYYHITREQIEVNNFI